MRHKKSTNDADLDLPEPVEEFEVSEEFPDTVSAEMGHTSGSAWEAAATGSDAARDWAKAGDTRHLVAPDEAPPLNLDDDFRENLGDQNSE